MSEAPKSPSEFEMPKPQAEHEWLRLMIGEWTSEMEMVMAFGEPTLRSTGTESVRAHGDMWIVAEGRSQMPDSDAVGTSLMTLGYDPQKGKFVGSFIASVMPNLWIYEGTLDAGRTRLTLDTEGPDFVEEGKLSTYQDTIEIVDANHRIMRSQTRDNNGEWAVFMTAHYRRR